jgi:hypothetical protein
MELLDKRSLSETLDRVNEALFFGRRIPKAEARRVAGWLASRHDLPGSYAGMFAPTAKDFADGIRLFTGHRISTGAATGHILGEEASRVLRLLDAGVPAADEALERANGSMNARLAESETEGRQRGFF